MAEAAQQEHTDEMILDYVSKAIELYGRASPQVRDYVAQRTGKSNKKTNQRLTHLVETKRLVRVTFGKTMYYFFPYVIIDETLWAELDE
tara:strand:- start:307 stop:573 length:267 start_codon:yes stop_codon:yes gene_type:complete